LKIELAIFVNCFLSRRDYCTNILQNKWDKQKNLTRLQNTFHFQILQNIRLHPHTQAADEAMVALNSCHVTSALALHFGNSSNKYDELSANL